MGDADIAGAYAPATEGSAGDVPSHRARVYAEGFRGLRNCYQALSCFYFGHMHLTHAFTARRYRTVSAGRSSQA
jgi:hypothetical protein